MTFLELAYNTLENTKIPLTVSEIWSKANEYNLISQLTSYGKTPEKTIGAQLYVDIKNHGKDSRFVQISKKPAKFGLAGYNYNQMTISQEVATEKSKYSERDLHPLLSKFVYSNPHFKCYTKTIHHELSVKGKKGEVEWLHPDIVGFYFPFDDYKKETLELISSMEENQYKLFSFEMKKDEIRFSNLRESYFQAVSNSSWANEGYLVALSYQKDSDLIEEMTRLNNAFGIGFIFLNTDNIEQSEILLPARVKRELDWDTIDRLADKNKDFSDFISLIVKDIKSGEVRNHAAYDSTYDNEAEFEAYLKKKEIL